MQDAFDCPLYPAEEALRCIKENMSPESFRVFCALMYEEWLKDKASNITS